jgi:hypothetical protein
MHHAISIAQMLFNGESGAVEGGQEPGEEHRVVYGKRPNLLPTRFLGPGIAVEPGHCSRPLIDVPPTKSRKPRS